MLENFDFFRVALALAYVSLLQWSFLCTTLKGDRDCGCGCGPGPGPGPGCAEPLMFEAKIVPKSINSF
jgi:hypothetical protein